MCFTWCLTAANGGGYEFDQEKGLRSVKFILLLVSPNGLALWLVCTNLHRKKKNLLFENVAINLDLDLEMERSRLSCLIYGPLKAIKKMLYFPFLEKDGSNQTLLVIFLMGLVNNEASDQIMR